jgi:pSer/pThr/pTyr-binding forkhead associated (FHA) protein
VELLADSDPRFKLVLTSANGQTQEFILSNATAILGRDSINDIVLDDPKISASHARFICSSGCCTIEDLGSPAGTRVNDQIVHKAALKSGDTINVGTTRLVFQALVDDRASEEATVLESSPEAIAIENSVSIQLQNNVLPRVVIRTDAGITETEMAGEALSIGRANDNHIVLKLPSVSRYHARLERKRSGFVLHDLNSENGVWMGRLRVSEARLTHGDSFRIGGAHLVFKHNFAPEDLTSGGNDQGRRPIVFVPGFAGSKLWLGDEQIWPRLGPVRSGGDALKFHENSSLEARGLVDQVVIVPNLINLEQYSRLADYLEEGLGYERDRNLLEFAYDFRQDIRISARALAGVVERWKVPRPITIIAHSMGCLVTRYYVDHLGGHQHVGRLILMGGPHAGVPKAVTSLFLGPKLLPFGWLDARLREVIATFPSTYQILPSYSCVADHHGTNVDVFTDDSWLPPAQRKMLAYGKELRKELSTRSLVPGVCIFGYGLKTITNVKLRQAMDGSYSVQPVFEAKGDSTVPERSAMLHGCEIHPVRQYHGALFVDNDVKMRLKIELTRSTATS